MLSFSLAVSRMDTIRNESITGQCDVWETQRKVRWFTRVQKRDRECIGGRTLMLKLATRRPGDEAEE